jgi:hypothetical protein
VTGAFDAAYSTAFNGGANSYDGDGAGPSATGSPRIDDIKKSHDIAPLNWIHNPPEWDRKNAEVINGIMQGRTNNRGTITLSVSQAGGAVTKTPVVDSRVDEQSVISFTPRTPNAAALMTSLYVTSLTEGGFSIIHASTDSTTAIFDYVIWT